MQRFRCNRSYVVMIIIIVAMYQQYVIKVCGLELPGSLTGTYLNPIGIFVAIFQCNLATKRH